MDNNLNPMEISIQEEEEEGQEAETQLEPSIQSQASTESNSETEDESTEEAFIHKRRVYCREQNEMVFHFKRYNDMDFDIANVSDGLVLSGFNLHRSSYNRIVPIIDTTTDEATNSDTVSSSNKPLLPTELSDEQSVFVKSIRDEVQSMLLLKEPVAKFIFLEGYGGTGKTTTVAGIRDIDIENSNSSVLYIANANSLCAMIHAKYHIETMSLFQFFKKALHLTVDAAFNLIEELQKEHKRDIGEISEFFCQIFRKNEFINIIFLDEFSMFSPLTLLKFMEILKRTSKDFGYKFLTILCGDFMHIPPVVTASMDYRPIIAECEKYIFQQQHHITDATYLNTIMQLTEATPPDAKTFLNELIKIAPANSRSTLIEYEYPFQLINEADQKLKGTKNLYTWLKEVGEDFFSHVLTVKAFALLNKHMHPLNLKFGESIVEQLTGPDRTIDFIRNFVCFADFDCYRLPLIRFFPYYVLSTRYEDYNGCIVHLICWDLEKGYVIVYYPYNKEFLKMSFDVFRPNLYGRKDIYGIPLQLAFAATIHKSQGQSFEEDIVVDLNKIDHRDLFAILSRIRTAKQIKNIY